jgi:hypothetical protein
VPVGSKLVFEIWAASVPEIMDGWLDSWMDGWNSLLASYYDTSDHDII